MAVFGRVIFSFGSREISWHGYACIAFYFVVKKNKPHWLCFFFKSDGVWVLMKSADPLFLVGYKFKLMFYQRYSRSSQPCLTKTLVWVKFYIYIFFPTSIFPWAWCCTLPELSCLIDSYCYLALFVEEKLIFSLLLYTPVILLYTYIITVPRTTWS